MDQAALEAVRKAGLDSVDGAFAYEAGESLHKPNLGTRRRTRLVLTDDSGVAHELYLKRYGPEPLKARLARIVTYGPRTSPAGVEFANIRAASAAGVPTMQAVAFDDDMGLLSARRSSLVVTAVPGDALERCGQGFLDRHGDGDAVDLLTAKLAAIVRSLHTSGLVHRDLYAAHVFLDDTESGPELHLIDLARAFAPRWRRFRWRVKDLAQLKYSMPEAWVAGHWRSFLSAYLGEADTPLARRYDGAVDRKVAIMRRRTRRRARAEGELAAQ